MSETTSAIYGESEAGRSSKVRQYLESLRQTISNINYDLAELLVEAQEKNYFSEWGTTLDEFVEQNLDIKARQAAYLMRIVKVSKSMGYHRTDIESIGISKLKEIFSLEPDNTWFNPDTQENEKIAGHIERLIVIAPSTGLEAIRAEVKRLKGLVGENDLTWNNYQTTRITKDNVILPGLEAFRKYLGSKGAVEKEGSTEYSEGFVYEMIFAEILSGAVHEGEGEEIQDEVETESYDEAA